jgi:hypothetical protein
VVDGFFGGDCHGMSSNAPLPSVQCLSADLHLVGDASTPGPRLSSAPTGWRRQVEQPGRAEGRRQRWLADLQPRVRQRDRGGRPGLEPRSGPLPPVPIFLPRFPRPACDQLPLCPSPPWPALRPVLGFALRGS